MIDRDPEALRLALRHFDSNNPNSFSYYPDSPAPGVKVISLYNEDDDFLFFSDDDDWLVIVRLEKLIQAQLDQAMRRRLMDELFENWLSEQIKQHCNPRCL